MIVELAFSNLGITFRLKIFDLLHALKTVLIPAEVTAVFSPIPHILLTVEPTSFMFIDTGRLEYVDRRLGGPSKGSYLVRLESNSEPRFELKRDLSMTRMYSI
eukprot:CAMPEP_0170195060 /NCGR_PEP_ID=MMETSP0040_2-20121228/60665_1 /TAXON_ID=641309 /ORGANISM="Lotharella oceanica, Strain CCMP622" /LENGTH=102 /DNA_ID=CAMNT_0010444127 /DNA_START=840 /DNA_END=1145 /DNA_ORIENTATION=+